MSDARGQTFSDAWHRVAGLRAVLRPDVRARRQSGHGKHWYVLSNPLSNEFFRISEDAYAFVSRLAADRTVEEVWRDTLARGPESMLSQQEVVQLLGQLNLSNLLQADRAIAGGSLFERYRQRRTRERRALRRSRRSAGRWGLARGPRPWCSSSSPRSTTLRQRGRRRRFAWCPRRTRGRRGS